jgi:uncharacterized protein
VTARLVPVAGAPALLLEPNRRAGDRILLVADVHLGLGASVERPTGPFEGSGSVMATEIVTLARAADASTIVVAGDAKHPIVGTPPALRPVVFEFFGELLRGGFGVELVPGNHDVGIVRHLPKEVDVHSAGGVVREGVGIFHGHRWPTPLVLRSAQLVAGHLHPGFRFAPTAEDPQGKRRCWVRVELPETAIPKRPTLRRHHLRAREIVILPAFNPLAGTESLNRERPHRGRTFLYRHFLGVGTPRAYLLDGTDLGVLPVTRERPRKKSAVGAARRDR